jgi:cation:H+ antiporter
VNLIIFAIGFLLLIQGADFLVDGAISIAKRLKISNLVIGLTVVSIGTSLPELIVNVTSSMHGNNGIAVGNVIGSNIANILLIIGITSIFYPLPVKKSTSFREIPFSLLITALLLLLVNQQLFNTNAFVGLSRQNGIIFLTFQVVFMFYVIRLPKTQDIEVENESGNSHLKSIIHQVVDFTNTQKWFNKLIYIYYQHSWLKSTLFTSFGILFMYLGGRWTVFGAAGLARDIGVSEELIALTIIAIGTSLPELITSLVAAKKGSVDIAVGNVVGSLVFNILWVLGLSSVISPISLEGLGHLNVDIIVLLGCNLLFFIFAAFSSRYIISRLEGVIFFVLYIAYTIFLINRG